MLNTLQNFLKYPKGGSSFFPLASNIHRLVGRIEPTTWCDTLTHMPWNSLVQSTLSSSLFKCCIIFIDNFLTVYCEILYWRILQLHEQKKKQIKMKMTNDNGCTTNFKASDLSKNKIKFKASIDIQKIK